MLGHRSRYEYVRPRRQASDERSGRRPRGIDLNLTIDRKGEANFVIASGASQFDFVDALTAEDTIDWSKSTMFNLNEYVSISADHRVHSRKHLLDWFISEVDPGTVHWIRGDAPDAQRECDRLNDIIGQKDVDVSFIGIGKNGHITFNGPPADFKTRELYIVDLDEDCRAKQDLPGLVRQRGLVP